MGFTGGFAGGVTLTLSLAYLAILTHQRNRQTQGDILRTQAHILNTITRDPADAPLSHQQPLPPLLTRTELAAKERANLVESAKDRWNAEIEGAVRWAQTKDWAAARESAEDAVRGLVGLQPVAKTVERVEASASAAGKSISRGVGAATRSALEESRAGAGRIAAETKEVFAKGVEKGKEVLGKAKASVTLAEERIEAKLDHALLPVSDVDRALAMRYEKGDGVAKSVEEILNERYVPIDEKDKVALRGV